MAIFPRLIYRFNMILIKISADFHIEICKLILKVAWKFKVARRARNLILKKNKLDGAYISISKLTTQTQQ